MEIRDFSRAPPGPSSEENPSKAYVFLLRQRNACECKGLEIQQAKPGNGRMEEGGLPARGAWSLRSAPLGAWTSCCFRSRGKPPNPRLRCARPGRCARLLLARGRHVVFEVGGDPRTLVSAALGLVAALGSSWRAGVMLFSKSGETPEPPSPLRSAWSLRSAPLGAWTS